MRNPVSLVWLVLSESSQGVILGLEKYVCPLAPASGWAWKKSESNLSLELVCVSISTFSLMGDGPGNSLGVILVWEQEQVSISTCHWVGGGPGNSLGQIGSWCRSAPTTYQQKKAWPGSSQGVVKVVREQSVCPFSSYQWVGNGPEQSRSDLSFRVGVHQHLPVGGGWSWEQYESNLSLGVVLV